MNLKPLTFVLFLFAFCNLSAQSLLPKGKLYIAGYDTFQTLGYIRYPDETWHEIGRQRVYDMVENNQSLLTAGGTIRKYDYATDSLLDSITGHDARALAVWNNQLHVSSGTHPYYRVIDLNTKTLLWSLDSTKVNYGPINLLTYGSKVYALLNHAIVVVDPITADTLSKDSIPETPFWPGAAINLYLAPLKDKVYVFSDYATGAPRMHISRVDTSTLQPEDVQFIEFLILTNQPVETDDRIYVSFWDMHFDPQVDSVALKPDSSKYLVLEYDPVSEALFLQKGQGGEIFYRKSDSTFSAKITVPVSIWYTQSKVLWFADSVSVDVRPPMEPEAISIYPNPAHKQLTITSQQHLIQEISLFNQAGQRVLHNSSLNGTQAPGQATVYKLALQDIVPGIYFIRLSTEQGHYTQKVLILDE